jgi:carbon starvation protein
VCRYVTEELTGIRNRYLSTAIVVALGALLAFTGAWDKIWPVFGASNQLVAALALFVASCWLLARGKPFLPTLVPAAFMLVTTLAALLFQLVAYAKAGNYLLVGITAVLIGLAWTMIDEVRKKIKTLLRGPR